MGLDDPAGAGALVFNDAELSPRPITMTIENTGTGILGPT